MPKPSALQKELFEALTQTFESASDRTIENLIADLDHEHGTAGLAADALVTGERDLIRHAEGEHLVVVLRRAQRAAPPVVLGGDVDRVELELETGVLHRADVAARLSTTVSGSRSRVVDR